MLKLATIGTAIEFEVDGITRKAPTQKERDQMITSKSCVRTFISAATAVRNVPRKVRPFGVYFCKFNKCETWSKQLMLGCINKVLFTPTDSSDSNTTSSLSKEHDTIRKELSDLSEKINALCSMNKNLQQEIKSTASTIMSKALYLLPSLL